MSEEFSRKVLRVVVGKVCQPLGVHGMQTSVCEAMTDVLKTYILTLARTTSSYCSHANRTEPNLADLERAFCDLGVDLGDLSEFLREVQSKPLEQNIPHYPIPRDSSHVYSGQSSFGESKRRSRAPSLSSEDEEYDHIPPYLPALPSQGRDDDKDEDSLAGSMEVGDGTNDAIAKDDLATPTPFDPQKGLPQMFRQRGFSSDFSEEGDSRRNSISEGGGGLAAAGQGHVPGGEGMLNRTAMMSPPAKVSEDLKPVETEGDRSVLIQGADVVPSAPPSVASISGTDTSPPVLQKSPEAMSSDEKTAIKTEPSQEPVLGSGKGSSVVSVDDTKEDEASESEEVSESQSSSRHATQPVATPPSRPPMLKLSRRGHGMQPPPLHFMSPVAEQNPILHGQQPHRSLSPITCSPGGSGPRATRMAMPPLSPLHTPPVRAFFPASSLITQKQDVTVAPGRGTELSTTAVPISPLTAQAPAPPFATPPGSKSGVPPLPTPATPTDSPPLPPAPRQEASASLSQPPPVPAKAVQRSEQGSEEMEEIVEESPSPTPEPEISKQSPTLPSVERVSPSVSPAIALLDKEPSGRPESPKSPKPSAFKSPSSIKSSRSPSISSSSSGKSPSPLPEVPVRATGRDSDVGSFTGSVEQPMPPSSAVKEDMKTTPVRGRGTSVGSEVMGDLDVSSSSVSGSSSSPSPAPASVQPSPANAPFPRPTRGGKTLSASPAPLDFAKVGGAGDSSPEASEEEDEEKEVFDFEQELIPDRLSLSPSSLPIPKAPPSRRDIPTHRDSPTKRDTPTRRDVTKRDTPPFVDPNAVVTEEVATLDSGVGGVGAVTGGYLGGRGDMIIGEEDSNVVVQTVIGRESPVSEDDIIQSSARAHLKQEGVAEPSRDRYSSDESDSASEDSDSKTVLPPALPVVKKAEPKRGGGRGRTRRRSGGGRKGVPKQRSTLAKAAMLPSKVESPRAAVGRSALDLPGLKRAGGLSPHHRHHPSPRGSRAPPLGNARPLPCSPLVVHFKRHMVPSLRQQEEEEAGFVTKAEKKAEVAAAPHHHAPYMATPHTPSSSPTSPTPSPIPMPRPHIQGHAPLTISINRRFVHHARMAPPTASPSRSVPADARMAPPTAPPTRVTPTEDPLRPTSSANRVKKLLARFGGGMAGTPPGSSSPIASSPSVPGPPPPLPNPRKRELDMTDLGFSNPLPAKRFRQEPQGIDSAEVSSSSSSSSSDDEDSGSDTTPTPTTPTPQLLPPQRYPPRPRTPSSIEEEEEKDEMSPLTPESVESSVGSVGSGLRLTISKALLPPATVQHLGGRGTGDKGSKKSRKATKPHKIPSGGDIFSVGAKAESSRKGGSKGPKGKMGGASSQKASSRSGGSQHQRVGGAFAPPPVPPVVVPIAASQGSETICPECGLKDDGSPMIGCDQCDSWVHWVCGGITAAPPEDQKWYCPDCRKAGVGGTTAGGKKRGRKRKKQL